MLLCQQVVANRRCVVGFVAGDDIAVLDGELAPTAIFSRVAFPAVEVRAVEELHRLFAGPKFDGRSPIVGSQGVFEREKDDERGSDKRGSAAKQATSHERLL